MADDNTLLTPEQSAAIKEAVIAAELKTSGEIRVFVERYCGEDVLGRAAEVFAALELHKTKLRNGILFYLAMEDRQFAILGDAGIHKAVKDEFWQQVRGIMEESFRSGKFTEGIVEGISLAGNKLIEHFPYQRDDINELPDEVIFG